MIVILWDAVKILLLLQLSLYFSFNLALSIGKVATFSQVIQLFWDSFSAPFLFLSLFLPIPFGYFLWIILNFFMILCVILIKALFFPWVSVDC